MNIKDLAYLPRIRCPVRLHLANAPTLLRCVAALAEGAVGFCQAQSLASGFVPPSMAGGAYMNEFILEALAGETLPPPLRFDQRADGGWRLENARAGGSVEGYVTS